MSPDSPGAERRPNELVVSSSVAAPSEELWRHAVSPARMNREFRPLLRMTFPAGVSDLTAGWRSGERQFRSWLLLGGVLPVEYDDVVFEQVEPGRRFLERSALFTQRVWEHERTLEPMPGGCRVTDRVHFVPRVSFLAVLYRPVFLAVFRWRHRNLIRLFGEVDDPADAEPV